MKYLISVCVFLSVIFYSCSDNDNDDIFGGKKLPIALALPVYHVACDSVTTEQIESSRGARIINSEEDLQRLFKIWNQEVPDDIKKMNYEKYSLLVSFDFSLNYPLSVKHAYSYTEEYGEYKYNYSLTYVFNPSEKEPDRENPILYFYYSGILVDKIDNNSNLVTSLSGAFM